MEQNVDDTNVQEEPIAEPSIESSTRPVPTLVLFVIGVALLSVIIFYSFRYFSNTNETPEQQTEGLGMQTDMSGDAVVPNTKIQEMEVQDYISTATVIDRLVSEDFSIDEIQNINDMESTYGFTFTEEELEKLRTDKFVIKNILDTNLTRVPVGDAGREFIGLYSLVSGQYDTHDRTQANSVFYTTDSVMNLFSILSVELMKEVENKYLYASLKDITKALYDAAQEKVNTTTAEDEKNDWIIVRDYFAVPLALLSTAKVKMTPEEYWRSDLDVQYKEYSATFDETDSTADTLEKADAYIDSLVIHDESKKRIKADLEQIFTAPAVSYDVFVFPEAFYSETEEIVFKIPFSMFKPRGTYTSSSQRRQYFRAVSWYTQIPFFLSSDMQTKHALHIAELISSKQDIFDTYMEFNSLIEKLVGVGDDLEVTQYIQARKDLGENTYNIDAFRKYIKDAKPPAKIKGMPADYPDFEEKNLDDVIAATEGMRFISAKFIPDSYWTSELTNVPKFPSMPSVLQIMTILGSGRAKELLPLLPQYNEYQDVLDEKITELIAEEQTWTPDFWEASQANGVLWTIKGLFEWYKTYKDKLPVFMQTPSWETKALLTSAGFWTESRHTNILYAKQSFAEKGGGGGNCDDRPLPPAAKGYVEPQPEVYARLIYVIGLLEATYKNNGYTLSNLSKLSSYKELLEKMLTISNNQLQNKKFIETKTMASYDINDEEVCEYEVLTEDEDSKYWEDIRVEIMRLMSASLPYPVEGPIIPIKDKRAAVVADVHTAYGSTYLEEGIGVPRIIFVAVKDINGPRLTVGFTYSHYEFESNDRLTDEQWQEKFYRDSGDYLIEYKQKSEWPTLPVWYQNILGTQ